MHVDPRDAVVSVQGLTKRYGELVAVDDLTFSLEEVYLVALRAELFKQRSTRTGPRPVRYMLGLVLFVVLLHGLGLAAKDLDSPSKQLTILFGWVEFLGVLFAALLGAMSITGEIRHGPGEHQPHRSQVGVDRVLGGRRSVLRVALVQAAGEAIDHASG